MVGRDLRFLSCWCYERSVAKRPGDITWFPHPIHQNFCMAVGHKATETVLNPSRAGCAWADLGEGLFFKGLCPPRFHLHWSDLDVQVDQMRIFALGELVERNSGFGCTGLLCSVRMLCFVLFEWVMKLLGSINPVELFSA